MRKKKRENRKKKTEKEWKKNSPGTRRKKDWTPPLVYFGIGESKWKIREQKRNSKSRTKT